MCIRDRVPYDWLSLALLLLISIAATGVIVFVQAGIDHLWTCFGIKSVSYTHLDVYKRQIRRRESPALSCADRPN